MILLNRIRYSYIICTNTYKEGKEALNYEAASLGLKRGEYLKKLNKSKTEHEQMILRERG